MKMQLSAGILLFSANLLACPALTEDLAQKGFNFAVKNKLIDSKFEQSFPDLEYQNRWLLFSGKADGSKCSLLYSSVDLVGVNPSRLGSTQAIANGPGIENSFLNFEVVVFDTARNTFVTFENAFNLTEKTAKATGLFSTVIGGYAGTLTGRSAINALKAFKSGQGHKIQGLRALTQKESDPQNPVKGRNWKVISTDFLTDRGMINETDDISGIQLDLDGYDVYFKGRNKVDTPKGKALVVQPWGGPLMFLIDAKGNPIMSDPNDTPKTLFCKKMLYVAEGKIDPKLLSASEKKECKQMAWNKAVKLSAGLKKKLHDPNNEGRALDLCYLSYCE